MLCCEVEEIEEGEGEEGERRRHTTVADGSGASLCGLRVEISLCLVGDVDGVLSLEVGHVGYSLLFCDEEYVVLASKRQVCSKRAFARWYGMEERSTRAL